MPPGRPRRKLLELDLKPRDIVTKQSLLNAMPLIIVTGGSTNAVLHLLAMARAFDVELTIDEFQATERQHAAAVRPQALGPVRDGRAAREVGGTPA